MAVLPTVEIRSPKNPEEKWRINLADYDPAKHILWSQPYEPTLESLPGSVTESSAEPEPEQAEPEHEQNPSVEDFEHDDDGKVVLVNIINPDNARAKLQIPVEDYDPDEHRLWSSHPRFQR